MENLKIKLSSRDLLLIFNYLDSDGKGYMTYDDFCNLSDERRNNLDPGTIMIKQYKEHGNFPYNFGKK